MRDKRKKVHVSALDCKESFMLFRSRTEILFIIMLDSSVEQAQTKNSYLVGGDSPHKQRRIQPDTRKSASWLPGAEPMKKLEHAPLTEFTFACELSTVAKFDPSFCVNLAALGGESGAGALRCAALVQQRARVCVGRRVCDH